jgi:hypothetical protein
LFQTRSRSSHVITCRDDRGNRGTRPRRGLELAFACDIRIEAERIGLVQWAFAVAEFSRSAAEIASRTANLSADAQKIAKNCCRLSVHEETRGVRKLKLPQALMSLALSAAIKCVTIVSALRKRSTCDCSTRSAFVTRLC